MFGLMHAKRSTNKVLSYDDFLSYIDDGSRMRLIELDTMIKSASNKLAKEGFSFDECAFDDNSVRIVRNQFGFYVDESHSLDSKEAYAIYENGLKIFYDNVRDLSSLHRYICEKEYIMNGNYLCKKNVRPELDSYSESLGYGTRRRKMVYEEHPEHPSAEYQRLVIMLDLLNDGKYNKDDIIEKCLEKLREAIMPKYALTVKRANDRYGYDFDYSVGLMVRNLEDGETEMVYEYDGISIHKSDYEKYFSHNKPYIDIYLRIITFCLKDELMCEITPERGLI